MRKFVKLFPAKFSIHRLISTFENLKKKISSITAHRITKNKLNSVLSIT